MPEQVIPSPMKDWKPIRCEKCERCENLEFATSDGTEFKSQIKCLICSNEDKKYAMRRYGVEYDDCWCDPYCMECETESTDLFIPDNKTICTASFVRCEDCIISNDHV